MGGARKRTKIRSRDYLGVIKRGVAHSKALSAKVAKKICIKLFKANLPSLALGKVTGKSAPLQTDFSLFFSLARTRPPRSPSFNACAGVRCLGASLRPQCLPYSWIIGLNCHRRSRVGACRCWLRTSSKLEPPELRDTAIKWNIKVLNDDGLAQARWPFHAGGASVAGSGQAA